MVNLSHHSDETESPEKDILQIKINFFPHDSKIHLAYYSFSYAQKMTSILK